VAFPAVDRALDALSDFIDGESFSFDVDSPPAGVEDAPVGMYDVGQIVRQYSLEWLGNAPNHATPREMMELLLTLDELTAQLEDAAEKKLSPESTAVRTAKLGTMAAALPGIGAGLWMLQDKDRRDNERSIEAMKTDLKRWRIRLDEYIRLTRAASEATPEDRNSILWEVTAPLFLGWVGGRTGSEVPLPEGGYPEGFNTELNHVADLATPWTVANGIGVWLDWKQRRKELLKKDIVDGAKDIVPPAATNPLVYLAAGLAVGGVGALILRSKLK